MRHQPMIAMAAGVFAASMFLAGCASGGASQSGGAVVDPLGTWGTGESGQPQLILTGDGRLAGTDGCNRLGGDWTEKDGTVSFDNVVTTLMGCSGIDTWLSGLDSATLSSDTMTVLNADGSEIGTLERQ